MWTLRLLLVLCLALPGANAQTWYTASGTSSNDTRSHTLSGTVVNSVTGEPIRRALVTMFYQQQTAVMTDADGRFQFDNLPAMQTTVTAQKPGYFSDQELSEGGRFQQHHVTIGSDATSPLVIKLVPEAILFGRIVDSDGLPIRGLMVRPVTSQIVEGRRQWQQGAIGRTDADGTFRISNLKPGAYFLIAGPGRATAFASNTDDSSDLGYPAVVYPSPTSPMRINAGQQVEANFTVKPELFYNVTGSVSGASPGGQYFVSLRSKFPGARAFQGSGGVGADLESGTFNIPRVAPGEYTLVVQRGFSGRPDSRNVPEYGEIPISVHRNLMGVTVAVEPMLTIPVNVRSELTRETQTNISGTARFVRVQIFLKPQDGEGPAAFSTPSDPKDPGSPPVLRNAVPGKYWVQIQPTFGNTYVASARLGTTDLLDGEVTLTRNANQGAIDVVIRDDGAKLRLKMPPGDPGTSAGVLVVPENGPPRMLALQLGPTGSLSLESFRPGTYTVLAFDDLGDIEYMDRDALEPYLSRGTKVTLSANQETTVTLNVIRRNSK